MAQSTSRDRERAAQRAGDRPAFVDRVDELSWLEHHLREAVTGQPHVLTLLGDAGIGKSRLVRELSAIARQSGMAVCIGRGYEDLTLPYLPLVEALRARLHQLGPTERQMQEELLGEDAHALGQLLGTEPESARAARGAARPDGGDQLSMYLGVAQALTKLAQSRPTLLILEDLHWADAPSLDLLGHIVFGLADRAPNVRVPLLLLCVSRPPQAGDRVGRLLARFAREPLCQTRELHGLSEPDSRRLIEQVAASELSHREVDAVVQATAGNPLFVQEVVHALQRQGTRDERRRAHSDVAPKLSLPDSITHAVSARIDALDAECARVLMHAALLGDRFSIDQLAQVLDTEPLALIEAIEPALSERLLRDDEEGLAFRHPLIRHVFYHRASSARRQHMHHRIAGVLERAPDAERNAAAIAQHLLAAGTQAHPLDLARHAQRAAEQSLRHYAWAEAARYFRAAAEAWTRARPDDHARVASLHLHAGIALRNDSDRTGSVEQLDLAIASYERAGDVVEAARALVSRTRASFSQLTYGVEVDPEPLLAAAASVEPHDRVLAGLLREALCELYWIAQRVELAEPLGEEALASGRELGSDLLRHHAALGLGLVRVQQLRFEEALACFDESEQASQRLGDQWLRNNALQRVPTVLQVQGRIAEAERASREALALATELHNASEASLALSHLASLALCRGDLTQTESYAQSTMTMALRSGYPWGGVSALPAMAYARCLAGAFTDACAALSLLDTPGKLCETPGPQFELLAALYRDLVEVLTGNPLGPALRERAAFYDAVATSRSIEAIMVSPLCALVEIAVALGELATVERACERLREAYARGAVLGIGWVFLVPRVLGVGASALGRGDEAERCFEQALEAAQRGGLVPERARAALDYARLLGAQGQRERAAELARTAAADFGAIAAFAWQGRAQALLRELGVSVTPSVRRPSLAPMPLSRREADLLRRVARGQSDASIADDLISSVTTTAADVRSLLAKIGAERRSGAVAYAYEQGLLVRESISGKVPLAILVTDLDSFTVMLQRLGDAEAQRLIQVHNRLLRGCLRAHAGTEVTHTGDGLIASFVSVPAAVRCAAAMQRALRDQRTEQPDAPLHVRMGISAGTPRIEEDRLFGTVVIAAVRICGCAGAGQILVSAPVREQAGDELPIATHGTVALKGFERAVELYAVQWTTPQGE